MAKDPLKNWRIYREFFESLFISTQVIVENSSSKYVKEDLSRVLDTEGYDWLREVERLAKTEIENLIFTNNNNANKLIHSLRQDLEKTEKFENKIRSMYTKKYNEEFPFHFLFECPLGLFRHWFHELIGDPEPISKTDNPHPRIFKNADSFLLFISLKESVRDKFKLADFSFIYRRMQKDGYIFKNVVDTEFRNFLSEAFKIDIDKTKLLDYCKTAGKESGYKAKKDIFKNL